MKHMSDYFSAVRQRTAALAALCGKVTAYRAPQVLECDWYHRFDTGPSNLTERNARHNHRTSGGRLSDILQQNPRGAY